jgi:hypothetical protein
MAVQIVSLLTPIAQSLRKNPPTYSAQRVAGWSGRIMKQDGTTLITAGEPVYTNYILVADPHVLVRAREPRALKPKRYGLIERLEAIHRIRLGLL